MYSTKKNKNKRTLDFKISSRFACNSLKITHDSACEFCVDWSLCYSTVIDLRFYVYVLSSRSQSCILFFKNVKKLNMYCTSYSTAHTVMPSRENNIIRCSNLLTVHVLYFQHIHPTYQYLLYVTNITNERRKTTGRGRRRKTQQP
jgi:hypothetical protein